MPISNNCLSSGAQGTSATPRYHKRAFAHNYRAPFIYHIILSKRPEADSFGIVRGDARISPGRNGCARIEESEIGHRIAKAIVNLQYRFPILQIYQFVIMPDHVHLLLRVKSWSEQHLDYYIDSLVDEIGADFFIPGYCDKPLLLGRSLDGLFRYLRENPHRLAMRQQFPQFFQRNRRIRIGNDEFEAYGNLFHLRNPDKFAVKISRSFTPEEIEQKKTVWLSNASKGSILVSPFISASEKAIRAQAEAVGGRIILITHETFPERYKPAAHDFDLCSQGRLLIITLGLPLKTPLTRDICQRMNALAQSISQDQDTHPKTNSHQ